MAKDGVRGDEGDDGNEWNGVVDGVTCEGDKSHDQSCGTVQQRKESHYHNSKEAEMM